MFGVCFVSETAHVELKSGRVSAPGEDPVRLHIVYCYYPIHVSMSSPNIKHDHCSERPTDMPSRII